MKKILFVLSCVSFLVGAEYIIPPEYDNMLNASESSQKVLISNSAPLLSNATKSLGGQSVKYRCVLLPKITCRATTPTMVVSVSEISLRDTANKLVNAYALDAFVENVGNNFKICGGAVGGMTWDNSTLTSTKIGNDTRITYTYTPNANQLIYYFFTNNASRGGAGSYMTVSTKQFCQ